MANPLPRPTVTGTLGEILVQLRLLEHGVQAAPPLKDSGNDLIAVKGRAVKFIQVKTSKNGRPQVRGLPRAYDLVFLVELMERNGRLLLDESKITVLDNTGTDLGELGPELVRRLWSKRAGNSNTNLELNYREMS